MSKNAGAELVDTTRGDYSRVVAYYGPELQTGGAAAVMVAIANGLVKVGWDYKTRNGLNS